jgi:gamma-glutamyltranspeptidase / glutathione hydrolase
MLRAMRPARLFFASFLALLAFSASTNLRAFEQPEGPSGIASRPLVTAKQHMVVAANSLAAEAGLAMLRKGGSAIDAAIATQMVLNLVEPQSSGIGGGAFLLYWNKTNKKLTSIDGRETAPQAATPELFLDKDGKPLPREQAMESGLSIGAPGVLAALALVHGKYGKLPWADLFQPAITLARQGFPISPRLATVLAEEKPESFAPEARAFFFDTQGRPWPSGYRLVNTALAETFELIARQGPKAFYQGDLANEIANAVQHDPRGPGKLSAEDLANYRAKEREPLCIPYRTYEICGPGPPSSGALAVSQVLSLIAPFDLGKRPLEPGPTHQITEAERLAFADRARYLGDPDFVPVPVKGLLDPAYLNQRRALIAPDRSAPHVTAGEPPNARQGAFGRDRTQESVGTSQISIVDDDGNALSMTTTIEQSFGSRLMVRGFLLNNQLTDFSFVPTDEDGRPAANRVEPRKRPRSSLDPTIVFANDRQVRFVLGSPGGSAIILYVLKGLIGLIDWHLDPQAAADLINFGSTGDEFILEPDASFDGLAADMSKLRHQVKRPSLTSGLHIIAVTDKGLEGGADKRREGRAVGD